MKFGSRELVFTSLLLGIVGGTYGMIVQPHARARRQRLAEIRAMDRDLASIGDSTNGLEQLAHRVEQQRRGIVEFANMLPQASEIQTAVDEVLKTAAANSLQSGDVQLLSRHSLAGVGAQPIKMAFTGNFNGFYSFLLQLETMHRVMRMTQIQFHDAGSPACIVHAEMTLVIYFDSNAGGVRTIAQAN